MKLIFLTFLLSFLEVLSAAAIKDSNDLIPRSDSVQKKFFDNKQLLQYLLGFLDLEPSFRLISKEFKESHDQFCVCNLAKIDPRLRNYLINIRTNMIDDQFIYSLACPTLRLEAPLYYLFSKYLDEYVSAIPQLVTQIRSKEEIEVDAATLRRSDVAEGRKFIEDVMKAFTRQVFRSPVHYPEQLGYFYILIKSCFNTSEFSQLGFPIEKLLLDAVRGRYPDHFGEEILRNFDTNSSPELAHEALKFLKVNLARIILNKPGAPSILVTYTDQRLRTTILHYCAQFGAVDLIDKCLEMGADPLSKDWAQHSPIYYAIIYGHLEATRILLELDKNDIVFNSILSPILYTCYNGRSEIMEILLSNHNITLIGNPLLSNKLAGVVLMRNDSRMAQVLLNHSGKLELSDQFLKRLYLLSVSVRHE